MINLKKLLLLLMLCLVLSGCGEKECIKADNFGFQTTTNEQSEDRVKENSAGPIAKVLGVIIHKFDEATKALYNNMIVKLTPVIMILLTLYIIFTGVGFSLGIVRMNNKELIIHIFKIAIIMQLIATNTSWEFFNGTLFTLFKEGVGELNCMIARGDNACKAGVQFSAFDGFIYSFISYETQSKIFSLMWSGDLLGPISMVLIEIIIGMFLYVLVQAVMVFIVAYLSISLLIVLFPIFLTFILFKATSSLFQNWLNQIYNYCLQSIMDIGSLTMIATLVINKFHKLLGFKVCTVVSSLPIIKYIPILNIAFWQPVTPDTTHLQWIPNPLPNPDIGCIAYDKDPKCLVERYPDLPYLQLEDNIDTTIQNDQYRIDQIAKGNYAALDEVFILLILVFLMWRFVELVPNLAAGIVGVAASNFRAPFARAITGMSNLATKLPSMALAKLDDNIKIRQGIGYLGNYAISLKDSLIDKLPDTVFSYIEREAERGRKQLNKKRDRFYGSGAALAIDEVGDMMLNQYVKKLTFGMLQWEDDENKRKDVIESFRSSFGINHDPDLTARLEQEFDKLDETFGGFNGWFDAGFAGWSQLAVGVGLVNPFAGVMLGTVGAAKAGIESYHHLEQMKELRRESIRRNLLRGVPDDDD